MRGVNKLVVEIKDTDSRYFERCLLFLRPQSCEVPQNELSDGAQRLLSNVMNNRKKRHTLPIFVVVLLTVAAALGGIAVGVILL